MRLKGNENSHNMNAYMAGDLNMFWDMKIFIKAIEHLRNNG